MKNTCIVFKCEKRVFGHGYCNMHYKRWRKTGDPGPATTLKRTSCSVVDCPEPHCGLGFCNTHWARFKATGKVPTTLIRRYGEEKPICPRLFCSKPVSTKGLCLRHYSRLKIYKTYESSFTWQDYDALWTKQGGSCAICSSELLWDAKSTHVDHDHKTGKIRGLLCGLCNQGLGSFRDDLGLLKLAIKYLKKR
jgi:hypothetical protein